MNTTKLNYNVAELRGAGLEAKWGKTSQGAPILVARNPQAKLKHQRETWWRVDAAMWRAMQKDGIVEAFNNATFLGDIFSL